ncbi:MAG: recombinase zinc beta ribbon domain-containing protein, partial [Raoultibacter sp.]
DQSFDGRPGRKQRDEYYCSNYRAQPRNCTCHYIRTAVVEQIILDTLREVCTFAKANKDEFVSIVMSNVDLQQGKLEKAQRRKLTEQRKRSSELDRLIRKLYEDNVSGKLSDKRFAKMTEDYKKEQEALEQSISQLQQELDALQTQTVNTEKFLKLVNQHTNFEELTTTMLNELKKWLFTNVKKCRDGKQPSRLISTFNLSERLNCHMTKAWKKILSFRSISFPPLQSAFMHPSSSTETNVRYDYPRRFLSQEQ